VKNLPVSQVNPVVTPLIFFNSIETNASKYDVEMAISERKRVIHEVCNDYRDVLAVEFKIAEISPNIYQEGQIFNTNLGMVVWVTDIGILKVSPVYSNKNKVENICQK
jgi:hypothetical protein